MKFGLFEAVLLWLMGVSVGAFLMALGLSDDVSRNTFDGYNCQPIQKVETLEEAKAIVKQYQER